MSFKEVENVSRLEPFKRYQYFIKKIADFEELWTIVDKNGDIGLSDIEGKTLIPVWPKEAYIKSCLVGNWNRHIPFKLTLDDFEESIISFVSENNYLVNVFPVGNKTGFVVNLNEFIRDLNEELGQYQ